MSELKEILENLGYKLKDCGKQYSCLPLYRESDNPTALTINKETGEFYDFVEGVGGSLDTLIEKTTKQPLSEALRHRITNSEFTRNLRHESELDFVKTFDKLSLSKLVQDHSYWKNRGIPENLVTKFSGGVSTGGKMINRYVFPVFNEKDELVGLSGRYLWKSVYAPKWKHLGQKTQWIYPFFQNFKAIKSSKSAILVESIGDMLALSNSGINNVIVTFGVSISRAVILYLLKLSPKKVIIALNNDEEKNLVGNRASLKMEKNLSEFFDSDQLHINLPSAKDFGMMNHDQILIWKNQLPQ